MSKQFCYLLLVICYSIVDLLFNICDFLTVFDSIDSWPLIDKVPDQYTWFYQI